MLIFLMSSRVTVSASSVTGLSRSAFSARAGEASKAAHSAARKTVFNVRMALAFHGNVAGLHAPGQFDDALLRVVLHGARAQGLGAVANIDHAGRAQQVAVGENQQLRG